MNRRSFIGRLGALAASALVPVAAVAATRQRLEIKAYLPRWRPYKQVKGLRQLRPLLMATDGTVRVLLLRPWDVYLDRDGRVMAFCGDEPVEFCTHALVLPWNATEPVVMKDRDGRARELYDEVAASHPQWWNMDPLEFGAPFNRHRPDRVRVRGDHPPRAGAGFDVRRPVGAHPVRTP